MSDELRMIEHNGIRYRPEDAERLGIKAQRTPANDKAERPTNKTKGARRGGRAAGTDADAPAPGTA